ncbi:hypothetical protein GCM10022267_38060 [Lentzea roselyniae]|uniref:Orn/Lys/Arg decarboxylases family 1 pyridoxal-P attachment site domain-containing protein n=1 Tax=Lentzea roselyniae TaxID=531940 RepID=A0ABP7B5A2_9PSEU
MDQNRAPVLEALQAFRECGYTPFNPPGHRQGRSADPRVLEILGEAVYAADIISVNGLDDRLNRQGVIEQAQQLMAEAVGAEQAFFSTCGSSLSVKSAMLSVAGPHEKLIVPRHAHKSVTRPSSSAASARCGCPRTGTPNATCPTHQAPTRSGSCSRQSPRPRACCS